MWGGHELGEASKAEKIHLELIAGVFEGGFLHRAVEAVAGIIDEYIDTAVCLGDGVNGSLEALFLSDVELQGDNADFLEVLHFFNSSGGGVDGVTPLSKGTCGIFANAGRGSGNENGGIGGHG